MTFKQFHTHVKEEIEKELTVFFDAELEKAQGKDQVLVDMVSVLREFVLRGGKRVGPMMVVLAYRYLASLSRLSPSLLESANADSSFSPVNGRENIFRLACAAEIHHLYLLNLDDMADRDVLRHGGPTLEKYYQDEVFSTWKDSDHHGRTLSSIAGALLNSFTFELLRTSGFSAQVISDVMGVITDMLFEDTVVGWQIQYFQNNEKIEQSSEEIFLKGLEYVTSRYKFVGPMRMGVMAAQTPSPHLSSSENSMFSPKGGEIFEILSSYGHHVGIAFQIQDDIMGLYGDPKEMGKAVGNDVREGKKTLLIQHAYHHSSAEDQQFLNDVVGRELSIAELQRVQELVKNSGSLLYSQNMAKKHVALAVTEIEKLPVQNEYTDILKELAQYMVERSK